MTVQIHKANDALLCVAGEPLRQFLKVMDMVLCGMDAVNIFGIKTWRYDERIAIQGLQGTAAVSERAYGGQSSGGIAVHSL